VKECDVAIGMNIQISLNHNFASIFLRSQEEISLPMHSLRKIKSARNREYLNLGEVENNIMVRKAKMKDNKDSF
jgi:hypothetical protein